MSSSWISDTGYTNRKKITVTNTMVSGSLANFPILFSSGTDPDLAGINSLSVKFYDSASKVSLPFEYEKWNSTTGDMIAWVQLPNISSAKTAGQPGVTGNTFYMYYDKAGEVTSSENPTGVWDSNYRMVLHMSGNGTNVPDSTSYGNSGTKAGAGEPAPSGGIAGSSQLFDGSNDWINCSGQGTDKVNNLNFIGNENEDFTLEAWVKSRAPPVENYQIMSHFHRDGGEGFRQFVDFQIDSNNLFYFRIKSGATTIDIEDTTVHPLSGAWHYAVMRRDAGTDLQAYVDGIHIETDTNDNNLHLDIKYPFTIGCRSGSDADQVGRWFNGNLDEVRVSDIVRSQEWLWTTYNTISANSFLTIGTKEDVPSNVPVVTNASGCIASSLTWALVGGKVTSYSGNAQIYYGNDDAGEDITAWDYSSQITVRFYDSGGHGPSSCYWSTSLPVSGDPTTFTPSTQYYYRAYASSAGWGGGEDWSNASTGFITAEPAIAWMSSQTVQVTGATNATISSQVWGGSGTAWFYWDTSDKGTSRTAWSNSYKDTTSPRLSGNKFKYGVTGLDSETTYYYRCWISSNWWPGSSNRRDWSDSQMFKTGPLPPTPTTACHIQPGDVYITGSSCYIKCWCTRWDEGNWDMVYETFLTSSCRDNLFASTTPGAVRELYNILGTPKYIDTTYASSNTLTFTPIHPHGISSLRQKRTIAVKNISDTFLTRDRFHVKVEGFRIDI